MDYTPANRFGEENPAGDDADSLKSTLAKTQTIRSVVFKIDIGIQKEYYLFVSVILRSTNWNFLESAVPSPEKAWRKRVIDEGKTREQLMLESNELRKRLSQARFPNHDEQLVNTNEYRHKLTSDTTEGDDYYHFLFENNLDAVLLTVPEGNIKAANPAGRAYPS